MSDPIMIQVDDVERPATPAERREIDAIQEFAASQPPIGG